MASTLSLVFVVSLLALGVYSIELQGSFLAGCQQLAGLPPTYRLRERVEVNDGNYYWISSIYPDTDCSGEAILRYDRIMNGVIGSYIEPSLWTGTGSFAYRNPTYYLTYYNKKKLITPLTDEGTAFAYVLCPSANFQTNVTTDVMDVTCPGLIYPCASDNYQEVSCLTVNSDGSFINCQRNTTDGSCTLASMVYNYYSTGTAPYALPPDPGALVLSDLSGWWESNCVDLVGLPVGWKISELSYWNANGQLSITNTIYSNSGCDDVAVVYDRDLFAYFGEESTPSLIYGPGARIRELATQYTYKYLKSISNDGAAYLNALCPQNAWKAGTSYDILSNDCLPFIAACNSGDHYEYIQAGLTQAGSLIRYTIDPVHASCSVATYSEVPFLESLDPPPGTPYLVQRASAASRGISFLVVFAAFLLHSWM